MVDAELQEQECSFCAKRVENAVAKGFSPLGVTHVVFANENRRLLPQRTFKTPREYPIQTLAVAKIALSGRPSIDKTTFQWRTGERGPSKNDGIPPARGRNDSVDFGSLRLAVSPGLNSASVARPSRRRAYFACCTRKNTTSRPNCRKNPSGARNRP